MKNQRCLRRRLQNPHSSKPEAPAEGTAGVGLGKLPSKNSTPHIAKEPLPVGAVNSKGQKKVVDTQGKTRFINMKEPRVKGPAGVPVKG